MVAVTNPARAVPAENPARRAWSAGKLADLVLAALANVAVAGAWALTAMSVMGSLAIPRRMARNSSGCAARWARRSEARLMMNGYRVGLNKEGF